MNFLLNISTDNAAFEEGGLEAEVSRILRELADRIDGVHVEPEQPLRLFDVNGNRVGYALLSEGDL